MKSVNQDHDGEDDGEEGGFEDPEHGEADDLQQCEQVNFPERNMAQVGEVWLVLRRHQEKFDPVPELEHGRTDASITRRSRLYEHANLASTGSW